MGGPGACRSGAREPAQRFPPGVTAPRAPGGSMVLTALSLDRHTAHPSTPLDPGLPDPDPDLDYGLARPSPAVPDRSGQGRGPRLQHCLPSAGTPPSFGGQLRSQRRCLGFALRELWDLGPQAVPSAALSPDSPCSPPRWMLCPGAQVQLRGSKRGQLHGPSHVGLEAWPLPLQAREVSTAEWPGGWEPGHPPQAQCPQGAAVGRPDFHPHTWGTPSTQRWTPAPQMPGPSSPTP